MLSSKTKTMDVQVILLLLLLGFGAGILSGLVGVGGGIIIVPGLVFLLGFSQKMAQGTSLAVLLLPVGILAVMQYYKSGFVDVRSVGIIAIAFLVGGFFGSKIAIMLPADSVKKIFAILLLLISIKMLFFDKKTAVSNEKVSIIK